MSGSRPIGVRKSYLLACLATAAIVTQSQFAVAQQAAEDARIYFIAGFASAFDDMDKLSALFAVDGVPTKAYPPFFWHEAVRDAARAYRQSDGSLHIVLLGHSMGALRAYDVAKALDRRNVPVDLVVGFDPTREAIVPDNVAEAVNFFLTPDVDPVVAGPGFAGILVNEIVGDIADIPHHDIIYEDALQRRAIAEIRHAIR